MRRYQSLIRRACHYRYSFNACVAASTRYRGMTDQAATEAPAVDPEVEKKYNLIRSVGEECVTEKELRNLVEKKPNFRLYDGFEPSGRMHIAQGVFKAMNVNKCTKAGGVFVFWVADWFALMNDKMGGDLEKIKTVGRYLIEVCLLPIGEEQNLSNNDPDLEAKRGIFFRFVSTKKRS